ncbi:MAG: RpiB/LacA/LacB family sugar-phosphate isomerase [Thermoguttaceae bacterium]|nr:RpiB/LacA/LacB family sugar-phosphate isomerase [Thermoguttaceae bacterium]
MNIAIGSDHRGGKVAYRLVKDLLLRDHYADLTFDARPSNDSMVGAFMIEGAAVSDSFDEGDAAEPPRVYPIKYGDKQEEDEVEYAASLSEAIELVDPELSAEARRELRVDYPDVAAAVASAVSEGRADMGVLVCGTGVGMGIVANKFKGVRAAVCYNEVAAELSRRHNDANVLCVSGEFLSVPAIESLVRLWLTAPYDGGRHAPRVAKIAKLEEQTGL